MTQLSPDLEALAERWPVCREFDLTDRSVVVVLGAYQGITMELLDEMYRPRRILGFEPQMWAAQRAFERLQGRPSCEVVPYGLSVGESGVFPMGEFGTDACSFINTGPTSREQGSGRLVPLNEALYRLNVDEVDLIISNIEGYEYRLLPAIQRGHRYGRIHGFCVQWHTAFGDHAVYEEIVRSFERHEFEVVYDSFPSWVYWRRISE